MGNELGPAQIKEIIIGAAKEGILDDSPLLSTVHFVTCQQCRYKQGIVLLDYLRTGEFEVGKTQQREIVIPQGIVNFIERENFTPIIINLVCSRCNSPFEVKLVTYEYLKTIINRPNPSRTMYA